MRIVFLGLPLAGLLLVADGHELVLAGVRAGLASGARRLRRRIGERLVVVDPHRDWTGFCARARDARADLLVSWFFTRKIPMSVAHACRLGGIGVHPSLLPRHRGPDPFFAAIDSGDAVTGVTVHKIAADYDTGAILAQHTLVLDPSWNAWQLARKLDRPSLAALRETVLRASLGDPLQGTPQDESLATAAPAPGEEERAIRWGLPAERIVRRIRALAPVPGAVTWIGDECLTILHAEVDDEVPQALFPGEAAVVEGKVIVRAQDRGVALLEAEREGSILQAAELEMLVARESQK